MTTIRFAVSLTLGVLSTTVFAALSPTYTVSVPHGPSLIANHLDRGGNTLGEVLPVVPEGTVICKFEASTQSYSASVYLGGRWRDPSQTLAPGEGVWIVNPTNAFMAVFSGVRPKNAAFPTLYQGYNLVSLPTPDHPLPAAAEGDTIMQYHEGYEAIRYTGGRWEKPPTFAVGEAFCYLAQSGPPPTSVPAFGTVLVGNPAGWTSPANYLDGRSPLSGPTWWVQLYGGPEGASHSDLKPAGDPIPFGSGLWAGHFLGDIVQVPDVQPGAYATLEIRAWARCLFETFEEAMAAHWDPWTTAGYPYASGWFLTVPTGGPFVPPPAVFLNSFWNGLLTPIPLFGVESPLSPREITRIALLGSDVDWGIRPSDAINGDYRWQKRGAQGEWEEAPQLAGSVFSRVTIADAGAYRAVGRLANLCDFEVHSPTLNLVVAAAPRWVNSSFDARQGVFRAELTDLTNGRYRIEKSTNLVGWSLLLTFTNQPGGFALVDSPSGPFAPCFYRAQLMP